MISPQPYGETKIGRLVGEPVRRRLRAATGHAHQIPLPPPDPRWGSLGQNPGERRGVCASNSNPAHLLRRRSDVYMQFNREASRSNDRVRVESLPSPCVLDEVPSTSPPEPGIHLFRIKDPVCVNVGSESQPKIVCRSSVKTELQVGIIDVGLVYHHVRRDLRIGERRHRHLVNRELHRTE